MESILGAFGISWKLLIIQIVNFTILLFVLQKYLYKPLLKMVDKRKEQIEKGIENSKEAEIKLTNAKDEANKVLSEARAEGTQAIKDSKERARVASEEIMRKTEEERIRQISMIEKEALKIKEKSMNEAKDEIIKISILGAEQILREKSR